MNALVRGFGMQLLLPRQFGEVHHPMLRGDGALAMNHLRLSRGAGDDRQQAKPGRAQYQKAAVIGQNRCSPS